ncbi:hypothetical protein HMPREF1529_00258 [Microbacterium sp. oral taxon 186 str. F0373]|uniref:class I SAM-dependent methyltransferase n=1 Tax=Microbacterium sp. oral taxon 186 TaxID=712383 RepID=UPI00034E20B7|nr:class I SAM-dependent methyltransferase [Microbacterium sp. oral taxon 186]EPD86729.1 hypothetical protein HMPREF1529_00258 [Microbacterium sp. oral taxon 186 str. F0373]
MSDQTHSSVERDEAFWLCAASYLLPAHYPVSAWTEHAPFAAWLVDVLRPRSVVELGTHLGYSCFAFAEAARILGIDVTVSAVDSWEGDEHAGYYGEEVFEGVRQTVADCYPRSVRLVRGRFADGREQYGDATVDLLHIDGRHAYEDVREDYLTWVTAVRPGGVILFHDIAERGNGFGVWRLWEELTASGAPSFSFAHGHGLGVLGVGDGHPAPIAELFTARRGLTARIRADFEALGARVSRQAWLETLPAEAERAWSDARSRAAHEEQLIAELRETRDRIDAMERSTSWRITGPLRAVGRLRRGRR